MEVTQQESIQVYGEIKEGGSQKVTMHGDYAANKRLTLSVEVHDAQYVLMNIVDVQQAVRGFLASVCEQAAGVGVPVGL